MFRYNLKLANKILLYSLVLFTFFSPLPQHLFGATSFMSGTIITSLIFLVFYFFNYEPLISKKVFNISSLLILMLSFHLVICYILYDNVDFFRGVLSVFLLIFFIFVAYFLYKVICNVDDSFIIKLSKKICWIFLIVFVGFFIPELQIQNRSKSLIPFDEPSHFALFSMPFYLFLTISQTNKNRIYFLLIGLLVALFLKNLTFLVGVFLLSIIVLNIKSLFIIAPVLGFIIFQSDFTYFTDRLSFRGDNNNLSVLVFRQGWELAIESFKLSNGSGIGINQLGMVEIETDTGSLIERIYKNSINVTDAGLTAPKLISEFGVLGIILNIIYLVYFYKFFWTIKQKINPKLLFGYCIYLSFFIDLFVRGIGYFNFPFVLFLSSLFIINDKNFRKQSISI